MVLAASNIQCSTEAAVYGQIHVSITLAVSHPSAV